MTREIVENCFVLTMAALDEEAHNTWRDDMRHWTEYTRDNDEFCLFVAVGASEPQKIFVEEFLTLFTYKPCFVCECRRPALKLYLPPHQTIFKCRRCHRLRYLSTTFNKKTAQGKALYQLNRLDKLSRQRMNIRTPIYRGKFTHKFQRFLRMCKRAGLDNVVEDAQGLMEVIKNTGASPSM